MLLPGMLVKHEGKTGVVIADVYSCCSPDQTMVVFEGTDVGAGTSTEQLEVLGPEKAQANFEKCGAGQGARCCTFLTVDPSGACCERFSALRMTLQARASTMIAKRQPVKMFPDCQDLTDGCP